MKFALATCALALLAAGCEINEAPIEVHPTPGGSAGPGDTITGTSGTGVATATTGGIIGGPFGTYDAPLVIAETPPPPISGGTLLVFAQGRKAAVADPERDQVVIVDIEKLVVTATIRLGKGDEPGRLIEDGAGFVHVALRGAGAVATLDTVAGNVRSRRPVCSYPRGLAYDAKTDSLHVACSGGELVTLKPSGGDPVRSLELDRDLRDVVIDGDRLLVSRFRSAELLVVEADGRVSNRLKPPEVPTDLGNGVVSSAPAVAWRTIAAPGGGALMVFQEEQTSEIVIQPGGYGNSGCGGVVTAAVSFLSTDGTGWTIPSPSAVLPVDIAVAGDNSEFSIAAAGITESPGSFGQIPVQSFAPPMRGAQPPGSRCLPPPPREHGDGGSRPRGDVVAVAYDPAGRLLVQTREPMLVVGDRGVPLPGEIVRDTGHELFHSATAAGIACASCHPEGREDGHVWTFAGIGARRTQSIGGGILGTEPFHWNGEMSNFAMLIHEVMESRMAGPQLLDPYVRALSRWIDAIPPWRPVSPTDPAAADRGRTLFNDSVVGCASCHTGAKMTNNQTVDVGTGAAFQVPSLLGVSYRAPFMHQGCAPTLADRFGLCGGNRHGQTATLTDAQRADLVAYLSAL